MYWFRNFIIDSEWSVSFASLYILFGDRIHWYVSSTVCFDHQNSSFDQFTSSLIIMPKHYLAYKIALQIGYDSICFFFNLPMQYILFFIQLTYYNNNSFRFLLNRLVYFFFLIFIYLKAVFFLFIYCYYKKV